MRNKSCKSVAAFIYRTVYCSNLCRNDIVVTHDSSIEYCNAISRALSHQLDAPVTIIRNLCEQNDSVEIAVQKIEQRMDTLFSTLCNHFTSSPKKTHK